MMEFYQNGENFPFPVADLTSRREAEKSRDIDGEKDA